MSSAVVHCPIGALENARRLIESSPLPPRFFEGLLTNLWRLGSLRRKLVEWLLTAKVKQDLITLLQARIEQKRIVLLFLTGN